MKNPSLLHYIPYYWHQTCEINYFYCYANELGIYLHFSFKNGTVLFSDIEKNAVTLPHSAQRKDTFLVETKENSKPQKQISKKKVYLGLLHHRLGHRSTMSILDGDTNFFGKKLISGYTLNLSAHYVRSPQ